MLFLTVLTAYITVNVERKFSKSSLICVHTEVSKIKMITFHIIVIMYFRNIEEYIKLHYSDLLHIFLDVCVFCF